MSSHLQQMQNVLNQAPPAGGPAPSGGWDPRAVDPGAVALLRQDGDPSGSGGRIARVRTEISMGDFKGALADLDRMLAADPGNSEAWALRAEALNKLKDYVEAEKSARRAIASDPNNPLAYQQLAWSLLKQKSYKEALEAINKAIELDPRSATNLAIRAYIRSMLGDAAGALEDMRAAAELKPLVYGAKLEAAKSGGKLYDPGEDEDMSDVVARSAQPAALPPGAEAGLAGLAALLALAGGLYWRQRGARRRDFHLTPVLPGTTSAAVPAVKPAAGAKVIGKYELVRVIGRGGMGEVYEARDLSLDRPVAVKRMLGRPDAPGATGRQILLKEARMVAALHHPAIVEIHEIIEDGEGVYLAFEFVRGKTISQLLAEQGRLTAAQCLAVLEPVCKALQFAHDQQVVHRDLKPGNIMITEQGQVKLMDFGIARSVSDADGKAATQAPTDPAPPLRYAQTRISVGTPAYLSPEASQGVVCRESDVFSLGVTLYQMLTGELPFGTQGAVADKLEMRFRPLSAFSPALAGADEFMRQALHADPTKRPRSPMDFLAALKGAAPLG